MTRLRIALVAHDARKPMLAEWVAAHASFLARHALVATGTTGRVLTEAVPGLAIDCVRSGPLGGDQQIGAMIATGEVQMLIFFVDPLTAMPHDVDVKALMRLAIVYDIPMALNLATAGQLIDFMRSERA